jgi:hypothetical protein
MFKRNWYLFTPLILIVVPALVLAFYMGSYGYEFGEAREALQHFVQSSTRYSQGYSDTKFGSIRPGMDGRRVFEVVGLPFERHDNDAQWIYSLPKGTTPYYHERIILFDRDKNNVPHVKAVVKRFHTP